MKKISLGSRKSQLLTCTGIVAAGLMSPMSLQEAKAACSDTTTGIPFFQVTSVTCTDGDNNGYSTANATNMTFTFDTTPGNMATIFNNGDGINILQHGLLAGANMNFNMLSSLNSVTSATGNGIVITTGAAAANHTFQINGAVNAAQGNGIVLTYGTGGTSTLNLGATSNISTANNGVFITSATGAANLSVNNAGQVYGNTGNGISMLGVLGSGSLTVNNSGIIGSAVRKIGDGVADNGISVVSLVGHNVTGNNNVGGSINSTGNGILLASLTGTSNSTNAASIIAGGLGISTNSGGNSTAINSATGVINSVGTGISVLSGATAIGDNAGSITSTNGAGMLVTSLGGTASGTNSSATSINAFSAGMVVTGVTGATADNNGGAIETTNGIGLGAITLTGPAVVNNDAAVGVGGTVVSTNGLGILATTGSGLVDVNSATGQVTSGGDGITAASLTGGAVTVDSGLVSAGGSGVTATAGGGSASVVAHNTVTADGLIGISAIGTTTGFVDITGRTVTNTGGSGVNAVGGSGNATIAGIGSTVTAAPGNPLGFGLSAATLGGNALVDAGTVDATNGGTSQGSGVLANSLTGTATVNLHGNPDVDPAIGNVTANGLVGVSAIGAAGAFVNLDARTVTNNGGIGVNAAAISGNADVEGAGSTVNASGIGILAATVTGNTWVDAHNVTSQNNSAIQGFGAQVDIDVTGAALGAGGLLTATVAGASTGNFSVYVDENASLNTHVGQSGNAVNAASGTGISVVNYGTINGNMNLVSVSGDNHIENYSNNSWNWTGVTNLVTGGNNILDNYGTASAGPLSLTNLVSGGDSTVNNHAGGTFNMVGLNGMTFTTGGDATINNDGEFNALGLNTFTFLTGGDSTFNNTGEFNVGGLSLFLGLDTFNADGGVGTAGEINMQNGLPFGALVMVGTQYNTEVDVDYYIDADVGSSPLWGADYMSVGGVSGAGVTYVHINDLNWSPGQYDPYGISLIGVEDGNADIEDFQLANGPIQKGFYDYNIYLDKGNSLDHLKCTLTNAGDCFILASTLGQRAYELPVIAYGAQQMWHTSTGVWTDRTADLRSAFGGTGFGGGGADAIVEPVEAMPVAGNVTPGIWGRVFGATQSRDFSNSYALSDLEILDDEINNNFKQDIYGAMAGIDFGKESLSDQGNQAWIFGLFGGYTGSNLSFDNTDTDVDYTAGSVGAYVTYLNGGLFIDTTIKADFGKMDYSSGGESASSDFTSVGGVVDAGYRFTRGSGWYIEPKATLAYVHTEFDDIEAFGDDVSFDNGESLRGRLGARVGTSMDRNGIVIEPYLEASLWNEFDGGYSAALFSNGTDLAPSFDAEGVYGEVALGSSFINAANGWSGFAKGAVQFGEDSALGLTGNLGVRKAW